MRKTESREQKTEFVKIRFFANLVFYALARRGIGKLASIRMTVLV